MSTTNRRVRNPYKAPQGFVTDPFTPLYHQPDEEVAHSELVEELLSYAAILEDQIAGDFKLPQIIAEIKENFLSFVRTGLLAYKVKVYKVYRRTYGSFKKFCEKALGVTHWQINRIIEAARVVLELAQNGFEILPQCEAQARPLTKFTGPELCANWQTVIDTTPSHKITLNSINEILGVETKAANIRLPKELYERIRARALELGLSVQQLLDMIFSKDNEVSPVEKEKMAAWEKDLEALNNQEEEENQQEEKSVPIGTPCTDDSPSSPPHATTETELPTTETELPLENPPNSPSGKESAHLPEPIKQARPLTQLTENELCANGQTVIDTTPSHKITDSTINEVLGVETKTETIQIPQELYERLEARALERGLSVEELLDTMFSSNSSSGKQAANVSETTKQSHPKKSFLDLLPPEKGSKLKKKRSKRGFGTQLDDDS